MFDIGFSELLMIGVVALLVIGPERMPKVARTAGHLFGRFQRYVSNVKADINREMDMDELRRVGQSFKDSVEEAARGVDSSMKEAEFTMRDEVNSIANQATQAMADLERHDPHLGDEVQKLRAEYGQTDAEKSDTAVPAQGELALTETVPTAGTVPTDGTVSTAETMATESEASQDKSRNYPV